MPQQQTSRDGTALTATYTSESTGADVHVTGRRIAATLIDVVVLACTHFLLLDQELRAALPGVALIDGGSGIARRIAYLTREQPWPSEPSPGIALFTGAAPGGPLQHALARFGLEDVGTL